MKIFSGTAGRFWSLTSAALTLIAIWLRFLPTMPNLPSDSPDSGWQLALNTAIIHGLHFGHDIVFTYGPYAPVADMQYHPQLRGLMCAGATLLAVFFATALYALGRPKLAALTALLLPLAPTIDGISLVLPLPLLLLAAQAARERLMRPSPIALTRPVIASALLAAPALALLPLMKLSLLPACLIGIWVPAYLFWLAGARRLAVGLPLFWAVSVVAAWRAAGQDMSTFPDYIGNGLDIIAGFNATMGSQGNTLSDIFICAAGAILVFVSVLLPYLTAPPRVKSSIAPPMALSVALLLVLAMKAGFLRHDDGHRDVAVGAIATAMLITACARDIGWRPALLLGAILVFCQPCVPGGLTGGPARLAHLWVGQIAGAMQLADGRMDQQYRQATDAIAPLAIPLTGTADIYSSGQAYLLAHGANWAPRPIFQSYSAYTPRLLKLNADHLLSDTAAQNILFRLDPIDRRLPSLDDGLSWPLLLSLYTPAGFDISHDLLWLRRAPAGTQATQPGPILREVHARLGETVALPTAPALWANITIAPTLTGHILGALAKASPLTLRLTLADGTTHRFTTWPDLMRTGFLLSPLVATTTDFMSLRNRDGQNSSRRVASFSLEGGRARSLYWPADYTLTLRRIDFPGATMLASGVVPRPAALPAIVPRRACYLDRVDNLPVPATSFSASSAILLDGWGIFDIDRHIAADHIDIGFADQAGHTYIVPAALHDRQDVGDATGNPGIRYAGFYAAADITKLPAGQYQGQIVLHHGDDAVSCKTDLVFTVAPSR